MDITPDRGFFEGIHPLSVFDNAPVPVTGVLTHPSGVKIQAFVFDYGYTYFEFFNVGGNRWRVRDFHSYNWYHMQSSLPPGRSATKPPPDGVFGVGQSYFQLVPSPLIDELPGIDDFPGETTTEEIEDFSTECILKANVAYPNPYDPQYSFLFIDEIAPYLEIIYRIGFLRTCSFSWYGGAGLMPRRRPLTAVKSSLALFSLVGNLYGRKKTTF